MIVLGVAEGIKSIGWILMLLAGVVYIYSIIGVLSFRANDPRNFRNLGVAILSVLDISTGDFLDYFFINYHGCDVYGYTGEEERCSQPVASPVTAGFYFISLVLIVGQIMMSLFIGVITNKMEEAAASLKETNKERSRLAKAAHSESIFASPESAQQAFDSDDYSKICATLNIISGENAGNTDLILSQEAAVQPASPPMSFKRLQFMAGRLTTHWAFESFIVCAIVVAGIETGIETSVNYTSDAPAGLNVVNDVVLGIFVAELLLKIFVVVDTPLTFFKGEQGRWNTFDMFVVVFAFLPTGAEGFATGKILNPEP